MKVYLSGGIAGLTFEEANAWRSEVTEKLRDRGAQTLNPLRGRMFLCADDEVLDPNEIVQRDLRDIRACDLVLARMDAPSIGTAIEIWQAYYVEHKPVILVSQNIKLREHPWLQVACTKMFAHLDIALDYIATRWADEEV